MQSFSMSKHLIIFACQFSHSHFYPNSTTFLNIFLWSLQVNIPLTDKGFGRKSYSLVWIRKDIQAKLGSIISHGRKASMLSSDW